MGMDNLTVRLKKQLGGKQFLARHSVSKTMRGMVVEIYRRGLTFTLKVCSP